MNFRKTLSTSFEISGVGLQTSQNVTIKVHPDFDGMGIKLFQSNVSKDIGLLGKEWNVADALSRTTNISHVSGLGYIYTVEHLLSAIIGCGIDDAFIEVFGDEIPFLDGSAKDFCEAINRTGIQETKHPLKIATLAAPVIVKQGLTTLIALPSDETFIECLIDYPSQPLIKTQFFKFLFDSSSYLKQIAFCRTFCSKEEATYLQSKGLMKGGSLDCAVVLDEDRVLTPGGLRCENEMVRHKILDLMGDLSLVGKKFSAHIVAICPGHRYNAIFAREILKNLRFE